MLTLKTSLVRPLPLATPLTSRALTPLNTRGIQVMHFISSPYPYLSDPNSHLRVDFGSIPELVCLAEHLYRHGNVVAF